MKLWLARHAQPLINAGVCYGVLDVSADEALTRQAAQTLALLVPEHTLCRISPLLRCQQLARGLALLRPDLSLASATHTDTRLSEINFGQHEGVSWLDIPKEAIDAWTSDFGNHCFGGQESANELILRVKAALLDAQLSQAENVLWITHAGVIRAAALLAKNIKQIHHAEQWPQDVPGFGCFTQLNFKTLSEDEKAITINV